MRRATIEVLIEESRSERADHQGECLGNLGTRLRMDRPTAALGGGLHRAAVEDGGGRLGVAALGEVQDGAEVVDDRLEAAGGEPAAVCW